MKIIEKKCPNCSANLDFEVGERNVQCGSCRRKYAIEYDHDKDLDKIGTSDVALKVNRKNVLIIIIIFIIIASLGTVVAVRSQQEWDKEKRRADEEFNRTVEEQRRQFDEESERMRKQYDEEYDKAVDNLSK